MSTSGDEAIVERPEFSFLADQAGAVGVTAGLDTANGNFCTGDLSDLASLPPFRGVVERIDQTGVSGWCLDIRAMAAPVRLGISLSGLTLVGVATAHARSDIQQIVCQHCMPAFRLAWSDCRFGQDVLDVLRSHAYAAPEEAVAIDIGTADGNVRLPRLRECPVLTNAEMLEIAGAFRATPHGDQAPAEPASVQGHLDTIEDGTVFGWARRGGDHAHPVVVELMIDGMVVAHAEASERRDDLSAGGIGDRAFHMVIPAGNVDGGEHVVEVRVANTAVCLAGSPLTCRLSRLKDAAWSIEGRQVGGWLIAAISGPLLLEVRSEGVPVSQFQVTANADVLEPFSADLPRSLIDGASHALQIVLVTEPASPLRCSYGGTQMPFQSHLLYAIDKIDGGIINGWIFDCTSRDDDFLEIELYDGRHFLARARSDIPREDVNTLFGLRGTHGFSIVVPARQFDGLPHSLMLRCRGETLAIPRAKGLQPKLDRSLIAGRQSRYIGKVEQCSSQVVSGWAADRMDVFHPVRVAIIVDGICEAIVVADRFEKRLQPATGGGYHGFRYEFPARLMNSSRRRIEARIVEGNVPLEFDPAKRQDVEIFFPLIDFFAAYEPGTDDKDFAAPRLTNIVPRLAAPSTRTQASQATRVSLIVLNWNGALLLEQMLRSVTTHLVGETIEIIVVDHGSADESLAVAEGFRDRVDLTIVARGANYSFSASNNMAARQAKGDYLFFVNNDIVFSGDCLLGLTAWLDRDPSVGIVGMRLVEPLPAEGGRWRYATHHRGIQFVPRTMADGDVTYFPAEIDDAYAELGAAFEMPAVTGAAFLCRKREFLEVGGFDETYFYGLEDVDLCLRLADALGKRIICDTAATALHNRSYTRTARLSTGKPNPVLANPKSQTDNARIFSTGFKRRLVRKILASLIAGQTVWRIRPLRVTFVVTDASFVTPAGDFYTAMEMAGAMRSLFGWETLFVKRDVADMPGTDVLVVMRHDFDLRKVRDANPGLITVAWVRNRVDEWTASPHFQAYNLIFCASNLAIRTVAEATGRTAHLLPIATNEERFAPKPVVDAHRTDIVFTGSYWGADREAVDLLDGVVLPGQFSIYGHGWQKHDRWRKHWRKAVPYVELPSVYPSAKLVIDDSHPVTRKWNLLNSRVFDALGSGTLLVTNCRGGAEELFGDTLPTFSTADELTALLRHYIDQPEERDALAAQLHAEVVEHHTYKHRARSFKEVIADFVGKTLRFGIKVGIPSDGQKLAWGDWHFALAIQRGLQKAGHHARIDILPDWYTPLSTSDDVVIVLRGLSSYKPRASQINLMWLISHPDEVALSELDKYDHVFVASQPYTEILSRRLGGRVSTLLQATDPDIFRPDIDILDPVPEVLFVGNSRGVRRPIVEDAIHAGLEIGVYGSMWSGIIPERFIRGTYLHNDGLRKHYSRAKIVLNDHWPDMKREGFISNRIFDAGACGAAIISDAADGLHEIFGDGIVTYNDADDLRNKALSLLEDISARQAMQQRLRQLILDRHTFDHRIQDILTIVEVYL